MPAVTAAPAAPKLTKQEIEWLQQAAQYKADGYNAGVVARKMITVHGMPEAQASAVVSGLFGKKVNARAGDTTTAVITGVALIVAGLGGAGLLFAIVGLKMLKLMVLVYAALLGVAGKGAQQAIIAMVNMGSDEPLK